MKVKGNNILIFILTVGVFSIINTEMGVIGILPLLAERFGVTITRAGLLISLFALAVAFSGPLLPLVFSGVNRKKMMLWVLGVFAAGNLAAFAATLVFVPDLPVEGRISCREQLGLLKRPVLILSIIGIIFMNGAVFGVFSFLSGFLENITLLSWNRISMVLLIYGSANILDNVIGGRLLTKTPLRTAVLFPPVLAAVFAVLYFAGSSAWAVFAITLVWGILGGINVNINQYWITSAAPEAPDFANGLFLTAANLGTTFGTMLCGEIIAVLGIGSIMFGGIIFLVLCFMFVCARIYVGRSSVNLVA